MPDEPGASSDGIPADTDAKAVLADPATSKWLKVALEAALSRDPVDAANDAQALADLLSHRLDSMFQAAGVVRSITNPVDG
jgi:hypothetical protein